MIVTVKYYLSLLLTYHFDTNDYYLPPCITYIDILYDDMSYTDDNIILETACTDQHLQACYFQAIMLYTNGLENINSPKTG